MNIIEEARNGREEAGQGEGAHGAGEEARAPISPGRKANLLADLTLTTHHQLNRMKTTGSFQIQHRVQVHSDRSREGIEGKLAHPYQMKIKVNIAKNNIYINLNNKNIHRILIMRHNKIK